jgi:subtilisin family serine protease
MIMATLRASGVLPVCAVGNSGPGTSSSPGNYDLVLSVGGCDAHREVDRNSSSQWFARADDPLVPDLVAPGVDVISARPGGGYQSLDGSSQAAPHLSGLAALLWQARPEATVAEIESAIFNSCALGSMPQDRANRGLPNGPRAYEILTGHALPSASPEPESSVLVN